METPETAATARIANVPAPSAPPLRHDDDCDCDCDDWPDEDEDEYPHLFQSIRSPTGLETGVRVTWPHTDVIELSTCLPSTEIAPMFHGTQWSVFFLRDHSLALLCPACLSTPSKPFSFNS